MTSIQDQLGIHLNPRHRQEQMSNTSGRPFDERPELGLSIDDPSAEFLSERDMESDVVRPARMSDELGSFALEDVPPEVLGAGRSRSLGWSLATGAALTALVAGSLTGLMMRGHAPSSERLLQAAVSGAVNPFPSVPVVPQGAAADMPAKKQFRSPTNSRGRDGKRTDTDSFTVARPSPTAAAEATVTPADHLSSGNDGQPLLGMGSARASLLLAGVPASPTANATIPASLAPSDVQVAATASDPDGDELLYRWSASVGRFANALERETVYTCPNTPTSVALTVTVTDGHGGIASDTQTIHCVGGVAGALR